MKIVTTMLLQSYGQYLLCQRSEQDALALKWEFPGGKLEKQETGNCIIIIVKIRILMYNKDRK